LLDLNNVLISLSVALQNIFLNLNFNQIMAAKRKTGGKKRKAPKRKAGGKKRKAPKRKAAKRRRRAGTSEFETLKGAPKG